MAEPPRWTTKKRCLLLLMSEDNRHGSVSGSLMFPMLAQDDVKCCCSPVWSMFCRWWFRLAPGGLLCIRPLLACVYSSVQCMFVFVQPGLVNSSAHLVSPC